MDAPFASLRQTFADNRVMKIISRNTLYPLSVIDSVAFEPGGEGSILSAGEFTNEVIHSLHVSENVGFGS
ncbi:hypothetical protein EVAR_64499_1 [Eumeta japonica]|uniref:Uncharacterized protein n=1 Tax=Eumeta variegata TaxID=151549 RepID=A0A4C1Z0E2_EUMVA|nr:hypothetical protein EVAR_64499_1 [Eumeta japonica]